MMEDICVFLKFVTGIQNRNTWWTTGLGESTKNCKPDRMRFMKENRYQKIAIKVGGAPKVLSALRNGKVLLGKQG